MLGFIVYRHKEVIDISGWSSIYQLHRYYSQIMHVMNKHDSKQSAYVNNWQTVYLKAATI